MVVYLDENSLIQNAELRGVYICNCGKDINVYYTKDGHILSFAHQGKMLLWMSMVKDTDAGYTNESIAAKAMRLVNKRFVPFLRENGTDCKWGK